MSQLLTFGVEPGRSPYRLRQARYQELGEEVRQFVADHPQSKSIRLLDVGVYNGVSRKYIEAQPGTERIEYHGVDIFPRGTEFVYKHEDWRLYYANLEQGLPQLADECFDIVICEQVLEHLTGIELALQDLARVLRPGGMLILGVPIFWPGLASVRKHFVPWLDRMLGNKPRGHVQAWSQFSFRRAALRQTGLESVSQRGFRIVSGGPFTRLEFFRWWWRSNRWVGAQIPWACTEVQMVLRKPAVAAESPVRRAA